MVLDNKKCIFVYGFDENEVLKISEMADKEKLPDYKIIDKSMGKMKVRDITEGLRFRVPDSTLPDEQLILFHNLNDKELNRAIHAVRNYLGSKPIIAVITDTSIEWSFEDLLSHLIQERKWFNKNKR